MIDLDVALYWTSLGVSAAGVVLFLWLMRERSEAGKEKAEGGRPSSEIRSADANRPEN